MAERREGEKTVGLQQDAQKDDDGGLSHSMLERWEDFHVKLLVSCWQKQRLEFGKGKATKKDIFNRIANEFNSISTDVKVTGEQCSRKWLKLEASHKKITDHNNTTGADKKTWKLNTSMKWSLVSGEIQMYDRSSLWRAAAALQTSLRTKTPRKVEMMKTNVPRPRALVQQNEKPLEVAVNAGKGKENQNLRLQRC
ncbi:unnamed protein product [Porites lobata]|uniref:Myb/SANT-like DNA-binding domain-containing protein n=1 Tax=Porites lobata TaxID=104759 RepID=A0ABN8QH15_9CNID|nr:unnamed protein product [Porites lobata]